MIKVFKALKFECPVCGSVFHGKDYNNPEDFVEECTKHLMEHINSENIGKYVPINVSLSVKDVANIMAVYGGHFDGDRLVVMIGKKEDE